MRALLAGAGDMETGLRRLRYFRTLAEVLNFGRAAKLLNITQPALSRAIAQLEQEVGVSLFERNNRNVSLTVAGHAFASGCGRILGDLDAVIAKTLDVAQGFSGYLNVGYTDTVIAGRLPDILRSFRAVAPDIHIHLTQVFTDGQCAMLDKGTLDIGLMTGPVTRDGMCTIDIQTDGFMLILPSDHPLADKDRIVLADLADQPFVLGDPGSWGVFNGHLLRHCERAGVRPRIVQTAPESRAIIGLVTCGLGISILPECLVRSIDPRLVARTIDDIDARLITQAGWMGAANRPTLRRFVEHLSALETFKAPQARR